jgi:hypothetical protein
MIARTPVSRPFAPSHIKSFGTGTMTHSVSPDPVAALMRHD